MASRLVSLVRAVLAGDISPSAAIDQLKDAAGRSDAPDATSEEAALADPLIVTHDIRELLDALSEEPSHLRVQDAGKAVVESVRILLGPEWAARAALEVGFRLMRLDKASFALAWLTEADATLRAGDEEVARFASGLRMRALADVGDWPILLEAATAAETIGGDARFQASALKRHAEALLRVGNVDEARPIIERAINEFDRAPAPPAEAGHDAYGEEVELLRFKGEIARAQGDFEGALAAYERARDAALRLREPRAAAFMLSEIGITWERAGDLARAAGVLEEARREAVKIGDWRAVLRWGGAVAPEKIPVESLHGSNLFAYAARQMLEPKPDYQQIREWALRCIDESQELNLLELEAQSRNLLAAVYEGLDRPNQAVAAVDVAIALSQRIDNAALELTFRMNRVRLRIVQHRFELAEGELPEIFSLADRLIDDTGTSELRQTIRVMLARACEYGVLCASLGWTTANDSRHRDPDPDRWIAVSQRGQAQNLTTWIALANLAEQLRQANFVEAVQRLRAADVTVERLATGGEVLTHAVTAQQQQLQRFRDVAETLGQPTTLRAPRLTRAEIEAAAPPNSTVVALYPLKDSVSFAAFSNGTPAACGRIRWTDTERETWLLRWDLAHADARAKLMPGGGGAQGWRLVADLSAAGALKPEVATAPEPLDVLLDEFQARLLEPLRTRLGDAHAGHKLIVVPHVNLSMLPFWRWAAVDSAVAVSVIPSLSCLTLLTARVRPVAGTWMKIGDATGTLRMVGRELAALPDHRSVTPALDAVTAELPAASIVHFAGHGYFNRPRPYDSGLVMGAPSGRLPFVPDPWRGDHAMLTVSGIVADLPLPRCYLATLSACCTGVPRRHAASEFTSLPAALLVAGARNVIASLWPAHDGAAALMMEELYRDVPRDGGAWSPSGALARARRVLAQLPRAEAIARLGSADLVPPGEWPFASPLFTMTFQHYGVD